MPFYNVLLSYIRMRYYLNLLLCLFLVFSNISSCKLLYYITKFIHKYLIFILSYDGVFVSITLYVLLNFIAGVDLSNHHHIQHTESFHHYTDTSLCYPLIVIPFRLILTWQQFICSHYHNLVLELGSYNM